MATIADDKTVTDAPTDDQRDRAREYYHDAFYLGTDGRGCDHYWSIYHQAVVRFDPDGDVTTLNFPAEKFLGEYVDAVAERHGGWQECRTSESLGDQLHQHRHGPGRRAALGDLVRRPVPDAH